MHRQYDSPALAVSPLRKLELLQVDCIFESEGDFATTSSSHCGRLMSLLLIYKHRQESILDYFPIRANFLDESLVGHGEQECVQLVCRVTLVRRYEHREHAVNTRERHRFEIRQLSNVPSALQTHRGDTHHPLDVLPEDPHLLHEGSAGAGRARTRRTCSTCCASTLCTADCSSSITKPIISSSSSARND